MHAQDNLGGGLHMQRFLARPLAVLVAVAVMVVSGGFPSPAAAAYRQTAAASWVPDGTVYAMARYGTRVYLGGDFSSLTNPATGETVARSRLAAVDAATGALVTSWNPGANATVRALAVGSNGTVYAGGAFSSAAGVDASRLAAITATGTAVSGWRANASNIVRDIAVDSTGVFVAGAFGSINGITRAKVARVSASTGALDTTFNARVGGGNVYAVTVSGEQVLLGGSFTSLSGAARGFSGSVSRSSGSVTTWAPAAQCDTCHVLDIATDGTKVYEGIAGPGGRAVAFSSSSGARAWSVGGDGDVQAVAVRDGVVYAGGHFTSLGYPARRQLIALDPANGSTLSWQIAFTGSDAPGVWAMIADSSALRIGGGFRLANSPAARYAAMTIA